MKARAALFPYPPFGHHPNFRGADVAAQKLLGHLSGSLVPGQTVLCYPDYVIKPLRKQLLKAGINVVVPDKYAKGYRLLEAAKVSPAGASSIAGAQREGLLLSELPELVYLVRACVALDARGALLSKGYGFAPELPVLPAATLAHPLQIVARVPEPEAHVQLYATPETVYTAAPDDRSAPSERM